MKFDMLTYKPKYLLLFGIVGWILAISVPLIGLERDYYTGMEKNEISFVWTFFPIILMTSAILSIKGLYQFLIGRAVSLEVVAFFIILVTSVVLGRLSSSAYAALGIFLMLIFMAFWSMDSALRKNCFKMISVITIGVFYIAILVHGLPQERWIGGIHPNIAGTLLTAGAIAAFLGWQRKCLPLVVLAIIGTILVSSRYSIMAIFIILTIVGYVKIANSWQARTAIALGGITIITLLFFGDSFDFINKTLQISDRNRGITSGFTGRSDLWANFRPQFIEAPLFGYGFRNREDYLTTHNAYMNLILENGILISGFLLIFITFKLVNGLFVMKKMSWEGCCVTSGLFALMMSLFFQPQLINFGDTVGVMFLILLAAPSPRHFIEQVATEPRQAQSIRMTASRFVSSAGRR